jgi:hypothetical protein
MAQTGEPYSVARRAVLAEHDRRFFPLSFDTRGLNWITKYADTLFGSGPGRAGVWVYPDRLHITMGLFRLDVPRASITNLRHSDEKLHGTTGTHSTPSGRLVVNGSDRGLVEFELEPPLKGGKGFAALIPRPRHRRVILSLEDPDGFITEVASSH